MKTLALLFILIAGSSTANEESLAAWLNDQCAEQQPLSESGQQGCIDESWADVDWYVQFMKDQKLDKMSAAQIDLSAHSGIYGFEYTAVSLCLLDTPANLILMAKCVRRRWLQRDDYWGLPSDRSDFR